MHRTRSTAWPAICLASTVTLPALASLIRKTHPALAMLCLWLNLYIATTIATFHSCRATQLSLAIAVWS